VLSAWGQRILLSHGDALCLSDHRYLAFRAQVRTEAWQAGFLAMPLPDRIRMATAAREVSENGRRTEMAPDLDIDAAQAVRWMHAMGAREMVHGHTHRPGSSTLAPGYRRHVLSDWDFDSADRADVLRLTRDGLERIPARRA
jgi:UDP-2,3-diacylglucosamine hydrolase